MSLAWKRLFYVAFKTISKKPLTYELLGDHSNEISPGLLYIYTLDTFIYRTLNTSTREHDH